MILPKRNGNQITFQLSDDAHAHLRGLAKTRGMAWGALAKSIVLDVLADEGQRPSPDLDTTIRRFLLLYGAGSELEIAATGSGLSIDTARLVASAWRKEREAA